MKKKAIISLCDRTGNMVIPWAENGYTCICVDIQNSIRATRSDNHIIKTFNGGGGRYTTYMETAVAGNLRCFVKIFIINMIYGLFSDFLPVPIWLAAAHKIGS